MGKPVTVVTAVTRATLGDRRTAFFDAREARAGLVYEVLWSSPSRADSASGGGSQSDDLGLALGKAARAARFQRRATWQAGGPVSLSFGARLSALDAGRISNRVRSEWWFRHGL